MTRHPLESLVEQRVQTAVDRGELSNLPNAGKPLSEILDSSEDLLARVVREQGGKPAYVQLNGKLQALLKRLDQVKDPSRRRALEQQIADMRTRMAIEKERGF